MSTGCKMLMAWYYATSETMVHILQTIKEKKKRKVRYQIQLSAWYNLNMFISEIPNVEKFGLTLWLLENSEAHPRRACCLATSLTATRRRCSSCVSCLSRTCSCFPMAQTRELTTKHESYSKERGEGHYEVGKHEAPVETFSISTHWPKFRICTMKVQCIWIEFHSSSSNHFKEIVVYYHVGHGDCLHKHKKEGIQIIMISTRKRQI